MAEEGQQSVRVGIGVAFGMERHFTLIDDVPHCSLQSKPLLRDSGLERENTERREVQQSLPELRDLSVVDRSCICHSTGRSFLGIG